MVRWWMCRPTPSTSSSAVAKKTRNASCLSVFSFKITTRRVESFIVSYVGYRFVTACSQMRYSVIFSVGHSLMSYSDDYVSVDLAITFVILDTLNIFLID